MAQGAAGWSLRKWRTSAVIVLVACAMVVFACGARAQTNQIFALGASNTNGKGVGTSQAWPAQLERMLRARGYDVTVTVNAVNGDTSSGVLSRTASIPRGTRVVVFDTGGDNDRKRGIAEGNIGANRSKIMSAIRSHGATPIGVPYIRLIGPMRSGGSGYQADGHHLTVQSHAKVAAYLLPRVIAAMKKK
ncbi:MAG TPA: GDSL-type esterase/lipase family protein [Pseudolabrys sp.]|nr:GDSL-type esterase/lipase family protein [Pseudolabrys sp.]